MIKKYTSFLSLLVLAILLSCEQQTESVKYFNIQGEAQGSTYSIIYSEGETLLTKQTIDSVLLDIDMSLSNYQENSLINQVNQTKDSIEIDSYFYQNLKLSDSVYQLTEGAFNPSLTPLFNYYGFGAEGIKLKDSINLDSVLATCNFQKFNLNQNWLIPNQLQFNFNAIAQGYTVDVLAQFLETKGIKNYFIEVGGELCLKGVNPEGKEWRIGIDTPLENLKTRELQAIIQTSNTSIATSGNYRKFYVKDGVKYSHTINPKTGLPVSHQLLSATVVHKNCALADAFATSFMVMGTQDAMLFVEQHPELELEYYLIEAKTDTTFNTYISKGLKEKLVFENQD